MPCYVERVHLLLIRHAIAADKAEFRARDDALRPLTEEGREKMEQIAAALRALVPELDALATSHLVRAVETAEIVAAAYPGLEYEVIPGLEPEAPPSKALDWLRSRSSQSVVAAVGHEPSLSHLASWLLTGETRSFLALKKGGACMLEFGGAPAAGSATLRWLLEPGQLRRLED
jgi:phosphohistidine phosphatase